MKYQWKKPSGNLRKEETSGCQIEILSMEEFREEYPDIFFRNFIMKGRHCIQFCKAESLNNVVSGTFILPSKKDPSRLESAFGYCLTGDRIIFADDRRFVSQVLDEMQEQEVADTSSPYVFLVDFMEYLIKDDLLFLQEYEEKLTGMEEKLLQGEVSGFDRQILSVRKDLSALSGYYQQLSDVGETLQRNAAERENEREHLLFGLYSARAVRMLSIVQMLKEYTLQLREMHLTRIDIRQNEIMQFLTVVTTIFMPLTLITGWYGMNFVHMPELTSAYGYVIICLLCFVIVCIEIWIFWKKKWFK